MEKRISVKTIILLLVISIGLIGLGVGSTYAVFTASAEINNPIALSSNLTYEGNIIETVVVDVPAGEFVKTNFNITNSSGDNLNYVVWYENVSDKLEVGIENGSSSPAGSLNNGDSVSVIPAIKNESDEDISVTLGVLSSNENISLGSSIKAVASTPFKGIAIYSDDDNSLRFYKTLKNIKRGSTYNDRVVTGVYDVIEYDIVEEISWNIICDGTESVVFEDSFSPVDTSSWFADFVGCTSFDLKKLDMSNVIDMSSMFYNCFHLTSLDLSGWNTKNVTDMSDMFYDCNYLTNLDLSGWNTENVKNMESMFYECYDLTSLNLSGWNTENVKNMDSMFYYCSSLTSLDLSEWNMVNVETMESMFYKCWALESLDLSGWNTVNVKSMKSMFNECENLTSLNLSNLVVSNVKNMDRMFYSCSSLTSLDLSGWDTSNVEDMNTMFLGCYSLTSIDFSGWNFENVQDMSFMFQYCTSLTSLNLSGWNTINVINMSYMFSECSRLTSLNLSGWNTANVVSMDFMFAGCPDLINIDLSGWNTANVVSMESMFNNCMVLTSLDLSGWNTENVETMQSMFWYCSSLTSLDLSSWNTINVTDMSYMFSDCSSLTSLDLSGWNTANVEGMDSMFGGCNALTSLNLSGWNTVNVTNMNYMFRGCWELTVLDLSSFDMSNVADMEAMFEEDDNVTEALARSQADADILNSSHDHSWQFVSVAPNVELSVVAPDNVTVTIPEMVEGGFTVLDVVSNVENQFITSFKVNGEVIQGNKFTAPMESGTVTISDVQIITVSYPDTVTITGDYSGIKLISVDDSKSVSSFKVNGESITGNSFVPSITSGTVTISDIEFVTMFVFESEHNPYPDDLDTFYDDFTGYGAKVYGEKTFEGATSLTVVLKYETEECCDHIYLFDVNGNLVGQYGGELNEETIIVPGNYIRILFSSDVSVSEYYGFKATITPNFD